MESDNKVISEPILKLQNWQLERFKILVDSVKALMSQDETIKARRLVASHYKDHALVRKLDAIDNILSVDGKLSHRLLDEVNAWTYNLLNFIRTMKSREEYDIIIKALNTKR